MPGFPETRSPNPSSARPEPALPGPEEGGEAPDFPIVVTTILSLNLLIFALQTFTGGSTNTFHLVRFGAQQGAAIENGEYWRFVTAAFLHIGFLHLLINGICLWQLGKLLEHLYGATHFAFLYLASGVGGTLTSFFLNEFVSPRTVSAGASGAIFGVAGAMLVAGLRYSDQIPESIEWAFGTGILPFIAFNLYYGIARGGVDNYAHIGGVLTGAVCGLVLHPHRENRRDTRIAAAGFALLVLVCFGFQYRSVSRYERDVRSALSLFQAGRVTEAETTLNKLRKQGTEDARVLTLSCLVRVRQGKINLALRDLQKAEQAAPRYVPAKIARGDVMMLFHSYPAAVTAYEQAARLDPGNTAALVGLGHALLAANRVEEAGTAFRQTLKINPQLTAAQFGLALTLERQESFEQAVEAYRLAIKLDSRFLAARHGLARVFLKQGMKDASVAELRQALEIEPKDEIAKRMLTEITGRASAKRRSR